MRLSELIEVLQEIAAAEEEDIEVRLATQESWPFENSIAGVTTTDKDGENVVYIAEGKQLGYASKDIWNNLTR